LSLGSLAETENIMLIIGTHTIHCDQYPSFCEFRLPAMEETPPDCIAKSI